MGGMGLLLVYQRSITLGMMRRTSPTSPLYAKRFSAMAHRGIFLQCNDFGFSGEADSLVGRTPERIYAWCRRA